MAVRTYTELIADIALYLDTSPKITAAEHRELETNIVDTLFGAGSGSGGRPYKVYTALLTQTGVNAPVATILENTLGGTVSYAYNSTGDYVISSSGLFTANKTTISVGINGNGLSFYSSLIVDVNDIAFSSYDNTITLADVQLANTLIEIRVYY